MNPAISIPLRHVLRRLRPRATGALVLLYHRVAELGRDPQLLAVTPARFAEQLETLRRLGPVVSLAEALRDRAATRRRFVVTFDDGYADNLVCDV